MNNSRPIKKYFTTLAHKQTEMLYSSIHALHPAAQDSEGADEMGAKFVKQNDKWFVSIITESTGTKAPQVGDIVAVKSSSGGRRNVVLTDIVETVGVPETHGFRTVATFINH
jgi:hypothetical protein